MHFDLFHVISSQHRADGKIQYVKYTIISNDKCYIMYSNSLWTHLHVYSNI